MAWRIRNGWCRDGNLERRAGAFAGVTTRRLGDMDKNSHLAKALRRSGLPDRWAAGWQVHGRRVRVVVRPTAPDRFPATDGLLTRKPGLVLCVRAADCVPIFIVDPAVRAAGAVHAGWRGVRKGILTAALRRMRKVFGASPRRTWVSLGPHIHACCYEVGPEVARLFRGRSSLFRSQGRSFLDLGRCLRREAIRAGVLASHVTVSPHCTGHDRRFFSYRRDRAPERMAAVFVLR